MAAKSDRIPESSAIADKETLEQCIRTLIRTISLLAQTFDGAHPEVRYAANVMIYKPTNKMTAEDWTTIKKHLRLCEEDSTIHNFRGVLDLAPQLSTIASDEEAKPDPGMCMTDKAPQTERARHVMEV